MNSRYVLRLVLTIVIAIEVIGGALATLEYSHAIVHAMFQIRAIEVLS